MKTLVRIIAVIVAIVVVLLLAGFLLPAKVHVERSIVIRTPARVPFGLINDLPEWKKWSPWHQIDPATRWEFSEPAAGTGSWFTWKSNHDQVGNGRLTIMQSDPHTFIRTKLEFDDWDASYADYIFKEENGSTTLTWTMDSDMGNNPVGRWFGLFMDRMIGKDYEAGLAKLREISEQFPVSEQVAGFDVEKRDMPAVTYLCIENEQVKAHEISKKIRENTERLTRFAAEKQYKITGPLFTIWQDKGRFSTAFPVGTDAEGDKEVKFRSEDPYNAYVVKYYGSYEDNEHVYAAMDEFIRSKGMKPGGPPREVYITGPGMEKDTARWLTEMVFPVSE